MTVVQENVNGFLSQNPDFVQTMRQELGEDASFVFDIKQAVRAGVDPYEMCRAMGDRIVHIHLNDNDDHRDWLVPWQGTMDYSHLFGQLFDQGFSQDIILEVYRTNFESLEELSAGETENGSVAERFWENSVNFSYRLCRNACHDSFSWYNNLEIPTESKIPGISQNIESQKKQMLLRLSRPLLTQGFAV